MESELSGIFRVKLVVKNLVLGFPPGTQLRADCSVMTLSEEI